VRHGGRNKDERAVAITQRTDALNIQGDAFYELAQVLHAAGRRNEAAGNARPGTQALRAQKPGAAGQVRKRLAEFQDAASR
jgi:hypothetical protein